MIPWFYNNVEYPLSGNVTQDISPSLISGMKGVPEIEHEVVTKVASYGDQLGALMNVVIALAEKHGVYEDSQPDLDKLKMISEGVEAAKIRVKEGLHERAEKALKLLKDVDPAAHKIMIARQAEG